MSVTDEYSWNSFYAEEEKHTADKATKAPLLRDRKYGLLSSTHLQFNTWVAL